MPSLVHNNIVQRQVKKLQKAGFICLQNVKVGKHIFDVLGLKLPEKKIVVVEVDVAHETSKRKIAFAERFAEVKVFRPEHNDVKLAEFIPKIAKALGAVQRLRIMKVLKESQTMYTRLCVAVGLKPSRDAGSFAYHLKLLVSAGLVTSNKGRYRLTKIGSATIEFIEKMEGSL